MKWSTDIILTAHAEYASRVSKVRAANDDKWTTSFIYPAVTSALSLLTVTTPRSATINADWRRVVELFSPSAGPTI